ncbi:Fe2+-dependent dioxygenase [Defluviimonas aestuarii]|uniref:Fe2+-dependent dioxygenase n=1 Tax=Albidovulum aestuarii TaxID=1130726 RepID=UPI00249B8929|nr:Fe2+-dependent dioxygenase [Defluviimonas aestuarii]MDI3338725.1 Fe2+-dependent dioxygenase [Defluviimonas aestuarii]
MFIAIDGVLNANDVAALKGAAETLSFADGRATAGKIAREIKANDQAAPSPELEAIQAKVTGALMAHPVFISAARPKAMTKLILSRYREGQTYGMHVDDALMLGLRTDLSFTLFLNDPDSYEGGALIVADTVEERAFKLAPGDLILYPSTTLHRVEPVTSGTRLCIVGWVQSWIRDAGQREILFDLDRSIAEVHAREGKSTLLDTLTKTRSNLIRMWAA